MTNMRKERVLVLVPMFTNVCMYFPEDSMSNKVTLALELRTLNVSSSELLRPDGIELLLETGEGT